MFDRMSTNFKLAMTMARGAAFDRGRDAIDTEHLLLGMIRVCDCVGLRALEGLGFDAPVIREQVARLTKSGSFDIIICAQALKHLPSMNSTMHEFKRLLRDGGSLVFSVTDPEMDWSGYALSFEPSFDLPEESRITHYRYSDYYEALQDAGLRITGFRQVPVGEEIRDLLTKESWKIVKGRFQIAIFKGAVPKQ